MSRNVLNLAEGGFKKMKVTLQKLFAEINRGLVRHPGVFRNWECF